MNASVHADQTRLLFERYSATYATHDVDAIVALHGVPVRFDCIDIVTLDADGLVARKDTFVDYLQAQQALAAAA